ncbi:hypothetical protein B6N60_01211 [Richelia sinica FACHB-800]|uniref:P/Homo B domain-containing protein n=1 Tax=Richelia sinica FACHB-800 TaxID=1357546 RepID=A0A975Y3V6_9NOST|nr:S8 family serine peptidase [Richelia sinica]MBD2664248.1 S8 family serine peptidase [Richelia sinica FACHB-800]QXE22528.1 hypothetical protein B6N60_01211 [Richelia sinica FACHB-800]
MSKIPNDPLFSQQWYLQNLGQSGGIPGLDINVVNVWEDYTGKGVIVAVVDDGVDYTHPDLAPNYNSNLDYDFAQDNHNGAPKTDGDSHGTSVAGIIGAKGGNGIGIVGVAYNATLTSFRLGFSGDSIDSSTEEGRVFDNLMNVDIASNSWGYPYAFSDNFQSPPFSLALTAIENAVTNGRGGKGTVIVFAAGNEYEYNLNTGYYTYQRLRYTIAVAALLDNGLASYYSTPGAAVLISAFGSDIPGSIVTTDRVGAAGYDSGNYTNDFNGTSAATPMVSGVVALMLEANPHLGYRDVQEILAYSARKNDASNPGWATNGAKNWNGGGLHVNHDYGFGLIDALAAVRLAETWHQQSTAADSTVGQQEQVVSASSSPNLAIPDDNPSGISDTITITSGLLIDRVEVDLDISHSLAADLVVTLISPDGTESILVNRPPNGSNDDEDIKFRFSTTHHWGETGVGRWRLKVKDVQGADVGKLNSWTLNLYGGEINHNNTYIYTNEFSQFTTAADVSRKTLTDNRGIDIINAAAITSHLNLNLNPGTVSTLGGDKLTIAAGTVIEKAFGGDGNDTIRGNSAVNTLNGGRGSDRLLGYQGNDILVGGKGNDTLDGGIGADKLNGGDGDDLYLVENLLDTVNEIGNTGIDTVKSSLWRYILPGNVERLTLSGTKNSKGYGNTLNNLLTGNSGDNILRGFNGSDSLYGGRGNDLLYGDRGNDVLDGNEGSDTIIGGLGNDVYYVDSSLDVVEETASGIDTVYSSALSFTLAENIENLTLLGTENISGTGNSQNNVIIGNSGNNTLDGGAGYDRLNGGDGNDVYYIDSPSDVVNEINTSGIDTVYSSIVNVTLARNFENLNLVGTNNINGTGNNLNNLLRGNSGKNILRGGNGHDTLNGGKGADTLHGGSGNDVYYVDNLLDVVKENNGAGIDTVYSSALNFTLAENVENLRLTGNGNISGTGNELNNAIAGNRGNNTLIGGIGYDQIIGGAGNDLIIGTTVDTVQDIDILTGGLGADTFVLGSIDGVFYNYLGARNYARIEDFSLSQNDAIQMYGDASQYSLKTFSDGTLLYLKGIDGSSDDLIAMIQGINSGLDLTASYFSFVQAVS